MYCIIYAYLDVGHMLVYVRKRSELTDTAVDALCVTYSGFGAQEGQCLQYCCYGIPHRCQLLIWYTAAVLYWRSP